MQDANIVDRGRRRSWWGRIDWQFQGRRDVVATVGQGYLASRWFVHGVAAEAEEIDSLRVVVTMRGGGEGSNTVRVGGGRRGSVVRVSGQNDHARHRCPRALVDDRHAERGEAF